MLQDVDAWDNLKVHSMGVNDGAEFMDMAASGEFLNLPLNDSSSFDPTSVEADTSACGSSIPNHPPVPETQPSSQLPHMELLNKIQELNEAQNVALQKLEERQRLFLTATPNLEEFKQLESEHNALRSTIVNELQALTHIIQEDALQPNELHSWDFLLSSLNFQLNQLELFSNELQSLVPSAPRRSVVGLAIVRQPFPAVMTQKEQLTDNQLVVKFITAANVQVQSVSEIKAFLIMDSTSITKGTSGAIVQNDIATLKPQTREAFFPLIFMKGTRKSAVSIRFQAQVTLKDGSRTGQRKSKPLAYICRC